MTVATPYATTATSSAALPTPPAAAMRRASRPARPAMPGATALPPLDALAHTHRQMVEVLADLTRLMAHREESGVAAAARRMASTNCSFFADNARLHPADEVTQVFPALIRTGDKRLIQHVLRLQQDHGWLEEDWLELSPQLQAVAQGYSGYDLDMLRAGVAVFTALYQAHTALKESLIYPAARRQLAAEAVSQQTRLASPASLAGAADDAVQRGPGRRTTACLARSDG